MKKILMVSTITLSLLIGCTNNSNKNTQTGPLSHSQIQEENSTQSSQGTPRWRISASTPYDSRSNLINEYLEPNEGFTRSLGVFSDFGDDRNDITEGASLQDITNYEDLRGQKRHY